MFGDGVFETCHISNQQILDFSLHLTRLKSSLNFLEIAAKIDDLTQKSYQLIKKNNIKNGILRINISRGQGSIGYLPKKNIKPNIIIQTKKLQKIKDQKISPKISLGISKKITLNSISQISQYKTNNSLNYILAKIEGQKNGFFDNILLNEKQDICETSSANIFWCKDNKIYTPSLNCGILNGTKRQRIIKICRQQNMSLEEGKFNLKDLKNCQEMFISNSSFLILEIDEINIGDNIIKTKTNEISSKILKIFRNDYKNTYTSGI